ncbi:MAG TPA: hypothetical protein P5568_06945 [Acidobacteriota bacterium]|jgi:siderophore synthetase component|nr:hypothetical protein [Acidobacteriota bacterium]HRV08193.1 hypothetical protein [Acidobacteriota bacterium]
MGIQRRVRRRALRLAKAELARFIDENEEQLLRLFREELQRLDDSIPEEQVFIDIKMVPLGDAILRACLNALRRFLREDLAQ